MEPCKLKTRSTAKTLRGGRRNTERESGKVESKQEEGVKEGTEVNLVRRGEWGGSGCKLRWDGSLTAWHFSIDKASSTRGAEQAG